MHTIEKNLPFHLQAYHLIKNDILNHRLVGGQKIVESTLSRDFNISRSPVPVSYTHLQAHMRPGAAVMLPRPKNVSNSHHAAWYLKQLLTAQKNPLCCKF